MGVGAEVRFRRQAVAAGRSADRLLSDHIAGARVGRWGLPVLPQSRPPAITLPPDRVGWG